MIDTSSNGVYNLSNAQLSHTGVYTCVPFNLLGDGHSASLNLTVYIYGELGTSFRELCLRANLGEGTSTGSSPVLPKFLGPSFDAKTFNVTCGEYTDKQTFSQ